MAYRRLRLEDGFVEYLVGGPDDAKDLLVFHVGTPAAAVAYPGLTHAAAEAGMRVATYSRGGYGASTRCEGRSVADDAAISDALADRLGAKRFFVAGWSGGGPAALACAALLGDRVRACLTLASIAPPLEVGPSWPELYAESDRDELRALSRRDVASLREGYEQAVAMFRRMTPRRLTAVGGVPDSRAIELGHDEHIVPGLVRSMRRAVAGGYEGFLDDGLAHLADWGFRVSDIRVPVVVRHGELDRLVDVAQGRWLAAHIPGARGVILPDVGHGSIALPWSEVIRDLVNAAR